MGFGGSKAKLYDEERPSTGFADVAGYEAAKREVSEVVDFLKHPEKYAHYLVEEAGGLIELSDLKLPRILNAPPVPYTRDRFNDNYQWTLGWGLVKPGATYENTVDNRAWQ